MRPRYMLYCTTLQLLSLSFVAVGMFIGNGYISMISPVIAWALFFFTTYERKHPIAFLNKKTQKELDEEKKLQQERKLREDVREREAQMMIQREAIRKQEEEERKRKEEDAKRIHTDARPRYEKL